MAAHFKDIVPIVFLGQFDPSTQYARTFEEVLHSDKLFFFLTTSQILQNTAFGCISAYAAEITALIMRILKEPGSWSLKKQGSVPLRVSACAY